MIKKQSEIKSLLASFTVVFARKTGLHIGPTHATLEGAVRCDALSDHRINRRGVRTLMHVEYILDRHGRAVVLIGDGEAKKLAASKPRAPRAKNYAPRARLSDTQVREIRKLAAEGETYADISRKFPVSSNSIGSIARGNTYRWVK